MLGFMIKLILFSIAWAGAYASGLLPLWLIAIWAVIVIYKNFQRANNPPKHFKAMRF